jgi:hypothetical protein
MGTIVFQHLVLRDDHADKRFCNCTSRGSIDLRQHEIGWISSGHWYCVSKSDYHYAVPVTAGRRLHRAEPDGIHRLF